MGERRVLMMEGTAVGDEARVGGVVRRGRGDGWAGGYGRSRSCC